MSKPRAGCTTGVKRLLKAIWMASSCSTYEANTPAKNHTKNAHTTKKSTVRSVDKALWAVLGIENPSSSLLRLLSPLSPSRSLICRASRSSRCRASVSSMSSSPSTSPSGDARAAEDGAVGPVVVRAKVVDLDDDDDGATAESDDDGDRPATKSRMSCTGNVTTARGFGSGTGGACCWVDSFGGAVVPT